jgi:hypothetical protein
MKSGELSGGVFARQLEKVRSCSHGIRNGRHQTANLGAVSVTDPASFLTVATRVKPLTFPPEKSSGRDLMQPSHAISRQTYA